LAEVDKVQLFYDRGSADAYGTFRVPYQFKAQDTAALKAAFSAWVDLMELHGLPVVKVATAGTYVKKNLASGAPSPHALGLAIDIDAVQFADGTDLVTRRDHGSALYLVVDALLRKCFNVVIDCYYNADHVDHYHVDMSANYRPFRAQKTTSVFVQGTLHALGYDAGPIDGAVGPQTVSAYAQWYLKREGTRPSSTETRFDRMGETLADYLIANAPKKVAADPEPSWAQQVGITDGSEPARPATRAEVWEMLRRYHELSKKEA